jgi:hypothetical protein
MTTSEVAEAELGQEARQCLVERLGEVAQVVSSRTPVPNTSPKMNRRNISLSSGSVSGALASRGPKSRA